MSKFRVCNTCLQEGELNGSADIDEDEAGRTIYLEQWDCERCGVSWFERFVHDGRQDVEDR